MTSQLELRSRAALCRDLARREPDSRDFWMAEADNWSRPMQQPADSVLTRRDKPTGLCYWAAILRHRNLPRFKARSAPSQPEGAIPRKDPFEEFLNLIAVEDGG